MLNEDIGFSGDIDRLKASAEAGDAEAQFNLGICYETGQGVKRNRAQAFRWCREAAKQGHTEAQFKLGVLYEKGRGVKRDRDQAVYWQRKAAEQGHAQAQFNLGYYYEYYEDRLSSKQVLEEAANWYGRAAEQGHAQAQFKLGYFYERGIGVQQDWTQAADWYGKAAEQDHTDAQNKLSECYYNGTGVEQDLTQALYWHGKAAEQGHTDAQDKPSERCGESAPKRKRGRGEDRPLDLFRLILRITMSVLGVAIPFVDPEMMNLTPVCQFIIAYLYVYAVVIVVVLVRILDRISKWALSIMLLLYFLSWATSIAFGFLVLGGLPRFAMIFFPAMFWLLILYILNLKDKWEAGML